jgi:hypothetical protein
MNVIYLRRRLKVVLPDGPGRDQCMDRTAGWRLIATLQKNLESFGFLLGDDVIAEMWKLSPRQVDAFYQRVVKGLRAMVGARRPFKPMYPDFPWQVMAMSDAELYFQSLMHYLTQEIPPFKAGERPPLADRPVCRIIRLGAREDFEAIFTLLAQSKSPFSPQDQEDVKWFVAQYGDGIARLLPDAIPCKENLGFLGAELVRNATGAAAVLDGHVRTATDVLRLAAAMSEGDVSLAAPCKFGKFRRAERVLLLGWIERAENRTEDMLRWRGRWVRLAERLHPGEYAARFPQTAAAFDVIRNDRPFATYNGWIEEALQQWDADLALDLLDGRPGELARRLDHLVRISLDDAVAVTARFRAHADKVSTPVLLQALTHFCRRNEPADLRVFFPKGNVAKVFATRKTLPPLPAGSAAGLASVCEEALRDRFAKLPALGTCFLDERLKNYLVPFSQRSASKTLRTLVRGSRLPLPAACTTLRFFLWWKNGKSRADIDLSAVMYGGDFNYIDTLAYYNLTSFGACHSGDIVDAPKGAAEFIDIDIATCWARGVRYVGMVLNSFTEQPYCDLPECFAGWMARKKSNSGEIFEPKTVVDKVDVVSDTRICVPAVFDLGTGEAIWTDIALAGRAKFANNVRNNLSGVSLMLRALAQLRKTDLHTLFALHIQARGTRVEDPEAAETVFASDRGITPFDLDRIAAEFM